MASTMKAWQYTDITGTMEESIILTEVPKPTKSHLGKDQLLVRVISAALNPVDYKLPESNLAPLVVKPPAIPGLDFCGEVAAVYGSNASFKPGDIVFGAFSRTAKQGTLGQFIIISSSECALLPAGVNTDDGAAVGTAAMTAFLSIIPGGVKPGARVFINGGAGGVGCWAIQFANLHGAEVTTTCSTGNVELCRSLGAKMVMDYKKVDILSELSKGGQVFDVAIDNAGFPPRLYECSGSFLKADGQFLQVAMAGTLGSLGDQLRRMILPSVLGGGPRRFRFIQTQTRTSHLAQVGQWIAEGKIRCVIDEVFKFEDVPSAFAKLRRGRAKGKIIIHVNSE